MTELVQLLDKEALDSATGKAGRATIRVPAAWLAQGDTIDFVVPALLSCARCEGGGCDRCDRSGGLRLDGDETARRVRLVLPKRTDPGTFVVRLVRPLDDKGGLEQLVVEIGTSEVATAGCTRVETAVAAPAVNRIVLIGVVVLAILAALVAAVRH